VTQPLLSVVVIGRNEGARLTRCLQSVALLRDVPGEIEVIYADSNSSDGSVARARETGVTVLEVKPARPTAAIGRNAGWRAARGEYVLFLDGDTIVHLDFAATAIQALSDAKVAIVWGHRREIRPQDSLYNRVLDLDWIYAPGDTEFCGGDAVMRRAVLADVDGYDENLIAGEEPEMCRRIRAKGWRILHIDVPMTGHDLAMTRWGQYWKRATRAGYAYAQVSARFRGTGDPFWEDDRRRNLSRGRFWIGLWTLGGLVSLVTLTIWGVAFAAMVTTLLALRSAGKARWKCADALTLILYGYHSHLQQIPILIGQWQYARDMRQGRTRGLIEYKEPAP